MGVHVFHGGHRWSGVPEIQPGRKGRYECGPGICTTNKIATAAKYAKGGGSVFRFEISPDFVLADEMKMPLAKLIDGAKVLRTGREATIAGLTEAAEKGNQTSMRASWLVNIAIEMQALSGKSSVTLAQWLAQNGIHGMLHSQTNGEEWLTIYDPKAILKVERLTPADVAAVYHQDLTSIRKAMATARLPYAMRCRTRRAEEGGEVAAVTPSPRLG